MDVRVFKVWKEGWKGWAKFYENSKNNIRPYNKV